MFGRKAAEPQELGRVAPAMPSIAAHRAVEPFGIWESGFGVAEFDLVSRSRGLFSGALRRGETNERGQSRRSYAFTRDPRWVAPM